MEIGPHGEQELKYYRDRSNSKQQKSSRYATPAFKIRRNNHVNIIYFKLWNQRYGQDSVLVID